MTLLDRVRTLISERGLFQPGDRVVAGVSGGPDSLCLLDVLTALAPDWRLGLYVAYLDHGLRPEAAAEAAFVQREAEARGWPFHTETVDTRAWAAERRQSLEEAARAVRYAFLARVAAAVAAPVVAVAHTADDQAETVLMHFLRGSGLGGLKGMLLKSHIPIPASQDGLWLVRPLLTTTRREVEAYCAEHSLRPVQDPSNQDTALFRNRLRHVLLPELETYQPRIRDVLRRTAEVLAGEHALLQNALDELWPRTIRAAGPPVEFDRARWAALGVPEQRALLRRAVQRLLPDERNVDFTPLEHAVRFSRRAAPGRSCDLLGGLRLKVTADAIVVGAWGHRPARADLPLLVGGQPPAGWRFTAEPLAAGAWSLAEIEANADPWRVEVDADRLGEGGWRLRARRPGDRFQPLGMGGRHVKLSDFYINARVDEALRDRWPLVVTPSPAGRAEDEIVWVAGLRLGERFKVTGATRRVVRFWFRRGDDAA